MLNSRKDFVDLLYKLINPLKGFYSKGGARLKVGSTTALYEDRVAELEGFARVLWGLAPLWSQKDSDKSFDSLYLNGIINGTDPESEEYWGELTPGTGSEQRIVEMAPIGLALVLSPEKIWDPLTDKQKQNLHKWLLQANEERLSNNNWHFFPVLVNLGLKSVGVWYDKERIEKSIAKYHSFYHGNGWYHDGTGEQADYYVSFAIHFYSLIYAKVMENEDPENSRIFKERAEEFAKTFVYWFDENGSSLAYGRSLTYRFAQCSFWSACLFADIRPFSLGVIKGIITRHLEWWLSQPIFDNAGVLSIGYAYPNLNMAEQYNAPGSPYWALKAFLLLALDENHEFFKVDSLPLPKMEKQITIPEAAMTMQRVNGYSVALTPGQWPGWVPTHKAEKYAKFAYSSRFAFSVSRATDGIIKASPDSMLAFEIDGYIFCRGKSALRRINEDGSVYSKWSPFRGIEVETLLIPTDNGHIRRHTVTVSEDTVAYDCSFATPYGAGGDILGEGEKIVIDCEPNSNLINPKTEIKAIKYKFKKGTTTVETVVIYP